MILARPEHGSPFDCSGDGAENPNEVAGPSGKGGFDGVL
jgi:hypothetical protein